MMNKGKGKPTFRKLKTNTQFKCPKCGSTEIYYDTKRKKLICKHCKHIFIPKKKLQDTPESIHNLKGVIINKGAADITENSIITLKCTSCGAEITINTSEKYSARCHWCRNILSVNEQIPNGNIPDAILPFSISKEDATEVISNYIRKRKRFALRDFKKNFKSENIVGVYFPYMLVDVNAHATLEGEGERLIDTNLSFVDGEFKKCFSSELYNIQCEFDISIDDIIVESNKDKLNVLSDSNTNNVINAILPFDTENCVDWNANYLNGYTAQKRDVDIGEIKPLVIEQAKDIMRHKMNEELKEYDRGVAWHKEEFKANGLKWSYVYLPVWLYSYKTTDVMYYVACNGRTKEIAGSVPTKFPNFFIGLILLEILGIFLANKFLEYPGIYNGDGMALSIIASIFLLGNIICYTIYKKYRNKDARHFHEKETKSTIFNLTKSDDFLWTYEGITEKKMYGTNNEITTGTLKNINKINKKMKN